MQEKEFETIISEQLALFKSLKEEIYNQKDYELAVHLRGIEKGLIDIQNIIEARKNEKSISSIKFKPWLGDNYENENIKILILGESHYGNSDENKETFTQDVIKSWALREEGSIKFFTTIAKVLSDKIDEWLSDDDAKEFWNKVVFYNYIQDFVGQNARIRPTDEMWRQAEKPFNEVLLKYQPDIVVVLGKDLGWYVEQYANDFEKIVFCYWTHPSAGFGRFDQQKSLEDFKIAVEKADRNKV
jgi:hypothetical protein